MIKDKYQMTGNPGPIADKHSPTGADIGMALARIESMLAVLCQFVEETPEGPILCVRPVRVRKNPSSSLGDDLMAMMRKRKAEGDT